MAEVTGKAGSDDRDQQPVNADTLALGRVRKLGPRGNYLAQTQTAAHCRDQLWPARYLGPHIPLSTSGKMNTDLLQRIDEHLTGILAEYRSAPLSPDIRGTIREVQTRFETSYRFAAG